MGPEFFQTLMGKKFYEGSIPRIVTALERIANHLDLETENSVAIQEESKPFKEVPPPIMEKVRLAPALGDIIVYSDTDGSEWVGHVLEVGYKEVTVNLSGVLDEVHFDKIVEIIPGTNKTRSISIEILNDIHGARGSSPSPKNYK